MTLGLIGIFYGAFLAFAQTDIKRLVAFSSVSHMGFVLIGIYSGSQQALQGAVIQMLAHGISAAALFILSGQLYERMHTRDMREMGGLWSRIAYLPAISLFFAAASLGLPGTGNFVGEFLILMGTFVSAPWITAIATSGLVLGSVYSLIMIHRAYFGPSKSDAVLAGMDARELIMVLGLAALLIWIGIYPQPFLDTSAATMHGVQQWLGTAFTQLASAR
jgi:NADH-quinone oxidoreductase subunit M